MNLAGGFFFMGKCNGKVNVNIYEKNVEGEKKRSFVFY
jgi:hypothetical protein